MWNQRGPAPKPRTVDGDRSLSCCGRGHALDRSICCAEPVVGIARKLIKSREKKQRNADFPKSTPPVTLPSGTAARQYPPGSGCLRLVCATMSQLFISQFATVEIVNARALYESS